MLRLLVITLSLTLPLLLAWQKETHYLILDNNKSQPAYYFKSKLPAPAVKTSNTNTPTKVTTTSSQPKKTESNKTNTTTENGTNGGTTQESAYNDVLAAEQAIKEIEKEAGITIPLRHIRNVNTTRKVVALTFDDGPHPVFTAQILRILDYYNAKASFFLVGSIAEHYPLWVSMEAHANHTIGSHTYSHLRLDFLDEEETQFQLEYNQEVLNAITSTVPKYFRPPGGRFNAQAARIVDKLNLTLVWWTVNTNDLAGYNADYIVNKVKEGLKPGAIILLHDGNQTTVDALPQILEYIKSQGYQTVSIEELDRISGIPPRKIEAKTNETTSDASSSAPKNPNPLNTNLSTQKENKE